MGGKIELWEENLNYGNGKRSCCQQLGQAATAASTVDLGKHGWWNPPDVRLEFCSEYQQVPASTKKDQKAQKITKKVKQTPNEVPKKMLVVQTNRLSAYRTCTALTSKGSR